MLTLVYLSTALYGIRMDCKDFIESIVTHLTGVKPAVTIEEDEFGAIITLDVTGRVSSLIGKNGVTIDAIRTLIKAIGFNGKHRIKLRINEQQFTGSTN